MQTPPPFHGYEGQQAPQKKKTSALVIIFAILGVLLVCCGLPLGFVGYFGTKLVKGSMSMVGCMVNVESMKTALHSYEKAHDGKLPNAATWQADIEKYMPRSKELEGAPMKIWKAGGEWSCEDGDIKTGFKFNEAISGLKVAEVTSKNPEAVAIFETKTVAYNQAGKFTVLPYSESPKIMGEFIKDRRGWLVITPEADGIFVLDKQGHVTKYKMNSKNDPFGGSGFDISSDSNSDSKSSKDSSDSNDSKSDNSN